MASGDSVAVAPVLTTALHYVVAIGDRPREIQVLLDDQNGDAEFFAHGAENAADFRHDVRLDPFGRLVEQQ